MPQPRIAHARLHAIRCPARIFPLPESRIVNIQCACVLQLAATPPTVVRRRCFRLLQSTALPPRTRAAPVFADIPHQTLDTSVVNIQILAPRQPDPLARASAPQLLQYVARQALGVLDDGVVVMPPTRFSVLRHRRVLRCGNPLRALHAVPVAPSVHTLYEIRPVQIDPPRVLRRRKMFIVICSRPRKIPAPEIRVCELHMVALRPIVVVGLLGEGRGFLPLRPPAGLVLLRAHGIEIDLHVSGGRVVLSANVLLLSVVQSHVPASSRCLLIYFRYTSPTPRGGGFVFRA